MPLSTIMLIGMGVVAVVFVLVIVRLWRGEKTTVVGGYGVSPGQKARGPHVAPAHLIEKAQHGNLNSQLQLGYMYANGKGVRTNLPAAEEWFNLAAASGNAEAFNALGMLYARGGEDLMQNFRKAATYYEKAASLNDVTGQINYANALEHGHGVLKSAISAYMWYTLAFQKADENERADITERLHGLVRGMNDGQIAEARKRADEWWEAHFG